MMGDELRLRHKCPAGRPPWEGTGHVIITGGSSEEVRACRPGLRARLVVLRCLVLRSCG